MRSRWGIKEANVFVDLKPTTGVHFCVLAATSAMFCSAAARKKEEKHCFTSLLAPPHRPKPLDCGWLAQVLYWFPETHGSKAVQ
jgi:hypothetical protein